MEAPPYNIERSIKPSGGSPELYLGITLGRQFLRPDSMRAFGRALNERFCRNRTIEAAIYDDRRGVTEWDPIHLPQLHATALRGSYFLDRETGKEYITLSASCGRGGCNGPDQSVIVLPASAFHNLPSQLAQTNLKTPQTSGLDAEE